MTGNSSTEPCTKKAKLDKITCDLSSDEDDADLLVSIWDTKSKKSTPTNQSSNDKVHRTTSSTDNFSRPSCSGLQSTADFIEPSNLTVVSSDISGVPKLKAMFPSLEEDVLQTYLVVYNMEECIQVISNFLYGGEDKDDCSIVNTRSSKREDSKEQPEMDTSSSATSSLPVKVESAVSSPARSVCPTKGKSPRVLTASTSNSTPQSTSIHADPSVKSPVSSNLTSPNASVLTKTLIADVKSTSTPTTTSAASSRAVRCTLPKTTPSKSNTTRSCLTKDGIASAIKNALTGFIGSVMSSAASPHKGGNCSNDKSPTYDFLSLSTSSTNSSSIVDWGGVTIQSNKEIQSPSNQDVLVPNKQQPPINTSVAPKDLKQDEGKVVQFKNELKGQPDKDVQTLNPKQPGNTSSIKNEKCSVDEELRNRRLQYYANNGSKKNQANGKATPTKVSIPTTAQYTGALPMSKCVIVSSKGKSGVKIVINDKSKSTAPFVGIDIRCGNNKVHPSMKRCYDQSAARRDIAKPYKRESKSAQDSQGAASTQKSPATSSQVHHAPTPPRASYTSGGTALFAQAVAAIRPTTCTTPSTNTVTIGSQHSSSASSSNAASPQTCTTDKGNGPTCRKSLTNWSSIPPSSVYIMENACTPSTSTSTNVSTISLTSTQSKTNMSSSASTVQSIPTSVVISTPTVQHQLSKPTSQNAGYPPGGKGKGPMKNTFTTNTSFSTSASSQSHVTASSNNSISLTILSNGNKMDKGKGPMKNTVTTNTSFSTSANSQSHAVNSSNFQPLTSSSNENEMESSSSLPDLGKGIENMNNELQSMLTNIIARNDRLTDLTNQHLHDSQPIVNKRPTPEEEKAAKEMQSIQNETEILSKLFPEFDPNYIFHKLEEIKDDTDRVTKVNEYLVQKRKEGGKSSDATKTTVSWSWESKDPRKLNSFAEAESNYIELHFKRYIGSVMYINFKGSNKPLAFDFKVMRMTDFATNRSVCIQRSDSNHSVGNKSSSNSNQLQSPAQKPRSLIEVFPGTSEFCRVESLLKKSIPQAHVTKIRRVENSWLQQKYNMQYELLKQKNGAANVNIKELFHGTKRTAPHMIWDSEDGIDMRYSGDGCMWGRGCYFAVHAAYSHTYSFKKFRKHKTKYEMFLAHVLTGDSAYLEPNKSIIKPPFNERTGRDYDSINGVTFGYPIYVLYSNAMSYPVYLITYTV